MACGHCQFAGCLFPGGSGWVVNGVEEDGELPGQAARLHLEHPRLGEGMLTWRLGLSLGFDTMSWAEWLGLCGQHVSWVGRGRGKGKL